MPPRPRTIPRDALEVLDRVLSLALREVRRARVASAPTGNRCFRPHADSNVRRCIEILVRAGQPLHIQHLIAELAAQGIQARRDSLASVLNKRVAPHGPFVRVAPNTFALARSDPEGPR